MALHSVPRRQSVRKMKMDLEFAEHAWDSKSGEQILVVFAEDENGDSFFGYRFGLTHKMLYSDSVPPIACCHKEQDWWDKYWICNGQLQKPKKTPNRTIIAMELLREKVVGKILKTRKS
jgi:hypothetical protein